MFKCQIWTPYFSDITANRECDCVFVCAQTWLESLHCPKEVLKEMMNAESFWAHLNVGFGAGGNDSSQDGIIPPIFAKYVA